MLRSSIKFINLKNNTVRLVKRLNHVNNIGDNVKSDVAYKDLKIKNKIIEVSNFAYSRYNEIIGFDEIDKEYRKINELQEDLAKCQSERTTLQMQINVLNNNLSNLQIELQDLKRGDVKYIELMRKEFELLQEKTLLDDKFSILDQRERDLFAHLQAKINIVHEKSRTHTRQWGIISTIIGATLGIIGTSISAYFRNADIRKVQKSFQMQFQEQIQEITKDTQQILEGYNKMIDFLNKYEHVPIKEEEEVKIRESWGGYLKRKSWSVWRWCTFQ